MADTGWTFPGTAATTANDPGPYTGFSYSNPDNIKLDDAADAQAVGSKFDATGPEAGVELIATNFGFAIPTGSIITGVEAKIEGRAPNNLPGELAYLGNSTFIGTEKTNGWTTLTTTNTTYIFGSSTDLWGATLTPAIVNGSNFGWIHMIYDDTNPLEMYIDYMQIKVYYIESAPAMVIMVGI